MWLGIDFGTTNTSAAFHDGDTLHYIPLDPYTSQQNTSQQNGAQTSSQQNLRSMIYIDSQQNIRIGLDAVQTFLREDTGRPVILEDRMVGTIENTVADQEGDSPITIIYDVTIHADSGIPGRLLQSIKTALRDPSYTGTRIFNKFYTIEELIALILTHVRKQAELHLKQPIHQAVIGRPVTFSHDATVDQLAEEKIRRAAQLAGFSEVAFLPEPIAAAAFYVTRTQEDKTILVFDFGGGTLDLTLLKSTASGQQHILASAGILIGGDDLDSAMMSGKVAPYFGTQSAIDTNFDERPIGFPETIAEFLNQWQTIPTLTRPQYLAVIERAVQYGDNPQAFKRLQSLATNNYGFALFQQIEQAKCVLSSQAHAAIQLQMGKIDLDIEVTKAEFNALISQEKSVVRAGIRKVIAASGLKAEQIDVIVATGGSSSIPAFQALLKAEIPSAHLVISDLFGSVTGGLAIHAHQLAGEPSKQ